MKQYVILFFLSFSFLTMCSQTRNYEVLLGSKRVGSVVATKTVNGDEITFKTDFKIKIRVIKLYDIQSVTTSIYESDILTSSEMIIYDDGELEEEKNILKVGESYQCIDCEDAPIVAEEFIYTNVTKVYFVEPIVHQEVYTERYLGFGKMTSLGDHKYKYEMPNGDKNLYNYKNGQLESIEVHRFLYDLTFKYVD